MNNGVFDYFLRSDIFNFCILLLLLLLLARYYHICFVYRKRPENKKIDKVKIACLGYLCVLLLQFYSMYVILTHNSYIKIQLFEHFRGFYLLLAFILLVQCLIQLFRLYFSNSGELFFNYPIDINNSIELLRKLLQIHAEECKQMNNISSCDLQKKTNTYHDTFVKLSKTNEFYVDLHFSSSSPVLYYEIYHFSKSKFRKSKWILCSLMQAFSISTPRGFEINKYVKQAKWMFFTYVICILLFFISYMFDNDFVYMFSIFVVTAMIYFFDSVFELMHNEIEKKWRNKKGVLTVEKM